MNGLDQVTGLGPFGSTELGWLRLLIDHDLAGFVDASIAIAERSGLLMLSPHDSREVSSYPKWFQSRWCRLQGVLHMGVQINHLRFVPPLN